MAIRNCILIWRQRNFACQYKAGHNFRMLASMDSKQRLIYSI